MFIFALILVLLGFVYLFIKLRSLWTSKHRNLISLLIIAFILFVFFPKSNAWMHWVSGFVMIWFMIYLLLSIITDLTIWLYLFIKKSSKKSKLLYHRLVFLFSFLVTIPYFVYGAWNNHHYIYHSVEIPLENIQKEVKIVFFTDLHLVAGFPKSKFERIIHDIDSIAPDIVLFGGDISDASVEYLNKNLYDSLFQKIKAPYGFYGVVGNHEAYLLSRGSDFAKWMSENHMHTLLDSTICNELLCISGRKDHQYAKSIGEDRYPLDYLAPADTNLAWIVIDHQPKGLEGEKPLRSPNLSLSGHTHQGQSFPINIIIRWIWPLSYGLGYLDNALWFVSSGVHTWGPSVRVGTFSELVILKLLPKPQNLPK